MKKAIIGNGGHAKEVLFQMGQDLPRFVDDAYYKENEDNLYKLSDFDTDEYEIIIAIGSSSERYEMVKKLPKETKYFSFIHPTSLIGKNVNIGEGSFIGAYSILTTNIKVGKHVLLNRGVQIGHDSEVGDFFSAMPNSIVSGNCKIGDVVYLGTNASLREKIEICDNVIIGLNSGVVKNITQAGTYGGVPCSKLKL